MRTAAKRLNLVLRRTLGSASFACFLSTLILVRSSSAQTEPAAIAEPAVDTDATQPDATAAGATPQAGGDVDEDFAPNTGGNEEEQPPVTDLETGLPLSIFLTPFHWGRFSLLSLTSYQGYNSNPEFQRVPLGSWVTSFSALALYSSQFAGWRMNLQYQPFIWISSTRTLTDFAAASFDIRTLRHINANWHWTLGERLRYSPSHSAEQSRGFIADPSGGFTIGNAFLSSGRNVLVNGVAATLTDRYNENSTLTFHANQDYTRLSNYLGSESTDNLPVQSATTYAASANWRDRFTSRDTLSLADTFRNQTSSGTSVADVNTDAASIGLSHKFTPTFGASASIGPAWSFYGQKRTRTTVHGSLALSKEFRHGGVVLSFSRSDDFSGVISDSFHNRYDAHVHREFSTRLNCSITGSYVQQQFLTARATTGELVSAEVRYFVSRNWATFAQIRYLDITGNELISAPGKTAIVGIRWSWVPEKP